MCKRRSDRFGTGAQPVCAAGAALFGAIFQSRDSVAGWRRKDAADSTGFCHRDSWIHGGAVSMAGLSSVSQLAAGEYGSGTAPYWAQVNHHFFFVLYSFVAMGLVTVFEWDLFFPDLLDVLVLGILPMAATSIFFGRARGDCGVYPGLFVRRQFSGSDRASDGNRSSESDELSGRTRCGSGRERAVRRRLFRVAGGAARSLGERLFRRLSLLLQGGRGDDAGDAAFAFPGFVGSYSGTAAIGKERGTLVSAFLVFGDLSAFVEGARRCRSFTELAKTGCVATLITVRRQWLFIPWPTCASAATGGGSKHPFYA